MQKWMYLTVIPEYNNGRLPVRYINGKEQPIWQKMMEVYEYLNVLGEDGWELIAAPFTVDVVGNVTYRYILKRPKP